MTGRRFALHPEWLGVVLLMGCASASPVVVATDGHRDAPGARGRQVIPDGAAPKGVDGTRAELVRRLRAAVDALSTAPHAGVHPPLGSAALDALERDLGTPIPTELRVLYSEIGVPEYWPMGGARIAVFFHEDLIRDAHATAGLSGYVPFADDSGPSWYFIDLHGRDGRAPGAVVRCDRGALSGEALEFVASDLVSFLRWLRDGVAPPVTAPPSPGSTGR